MTSAVTTQSNIKLRSHGNASVTNMEDEYELTNGATATGSGSGYNTFHKEQRPGNGEDRPGGGSDSPSADQGATFSMQQALDRIGFGPSQILVSLYFGLAYMAESMEVMLISVLTPVFRCVFGMDAFQLAMLPMIVFLGMMVSGSVWGLIGDKYGRRTSLLMACMVCAYFGLLSAFSPNYWWIIGSRFLVSFGIGGFPQMFTYYSEFLPTKSRSTCIVFMALIWALGAGLVILLAVCTLPTGHWRLFLAAAVTPLVVVGCLFKLVPESPRHLLAHGRYNEALVILNRIAKMNGKTMPEGRLYHPCENVVDSNRLADIFTPKYLKTTILLAVILTCCGACYFGTAFLTTTLFNLKDGCHGYSKGQRSVEDVGCQSFCVSLDTEDYIDLLYTSLGDMPGVLLCIFLMSVMNRKLALGFQMGVFTVCMVAALLCTPREVLVILLFIARGVSNGAGQGLFVYIAEVYPTSIRAIGMGWCIMFKAIGIILSSLMAIVLLDISAFLAISSFVAAGVASTISILFLPYETRNKNMADTLEENVR